MAFSQTVIDQAWQRSGGRCECTRNSHGHYSRCNKQLDKSNPGRTGKGCWEAHHINSYGVVTIFLTVKFYALIVMLKQIRLEDCNNHFF